MLGVNMKFIDVLIPLIFLSAIIDATPVDKPGAHAMDRFVPMRPKANLQERGNNPTDVDASKICLSYDMNKDGFVVAEEIWASEAYGDPTQSIGNAQIWVAAFDEDNDGQLNKMECLKFVISDPTTLCDIMDEDNDKAISSDELMNTPDVVLTLRLPYSPHLEDQEEADFAIKLYDMEILGGNGNGAMELAECNAFFKPNENTPRAICKFIASENNGISTIDLQAHFQMMMHDEFPLNLAAFVFSIFDKNGDENLDETECVTFFKYEHEGHDLH